LYAELDRISLKAALCIKPEVTAKAAQAWTRSNHYLVPWYEAEADSSYLGYSGLAATYPTDCGLYSDSDLDI
jgi:hypothetical protein